MVQEGRRSPLLGALVVGLGEYGSLTTAALTETVRCGVLRLLVVLHERCAERGDGASIDEVGLAPLLLGYNSTTHISIEDSLAAVVRGVVAANRQFAEVMSGSRLQVTELEFTELYRDTAISAAHALLVLPKRLQSELARAQVILEPAPLLRHGIGSRPRLLDAGSNSGYWPRLVVTDADDPESRGVEVGSTGSGPTAPSPMRVAERLRYLYLSQRARAEVEVRQRQPQLIEKLVAGAIQSTQYDPELSRLFFQLMVPLDFKEPARLAERLLLVVDGATANFPWEMLVAEEEPVVVRTQLIRQLASTRYRAQIKQASTPSAFVVGNPSTEGFGSVFPVDDPKLQNRLPPLPGAAKEADLVAGILRGEGFDVLSAGTWPEARSVLEGLFCRPHRILHIAAHGLFGYRGKDGQPRTGVVLSDGLILSAVEIGQLERVPELVFLNCCHLGTADALPRETSKIAYSLARELIEAGVRCVIAAGWEVDDAAAELFARTFYTVLITDGRSFAEAVLEGRKRVWEEMRDCNTWGAYQAYGDPSYCIGRVVESTGPRKERTWVSPLELEAEISQLTLRASRRGEGPVSVTQGDLDRLLASAPPSFVALAEIQEAVGRFEAELGNFAAASASYLKAIRASGAWGGLTVRAVEQLANLEARQGEKTGDLKLVDSAVRRLEGLLGVAPGGPPPSSEGAVCPANPERLALLASAEKRRAAVILRSGGGAAGCRQALERARDYYRAGMGSVDGSEFNGYLATNYLQLAALTGMSDPAAEAVAARAAELATAEFVHNPEFFTAIIPVDAQFTVAWLNGRLAAEAASLVQSYRAAAQLVPASTRKWDSVTRQLKLLGEFGRELGMAAEDLQALDRIARDLGGASAEPKPSAPVAPTPKPLLTAVPASQPKRSRPTQRSATTPKGKR
jgi:CHAT domain-containing protein